MEQLKTIILERRKSLRLTQKELAQKLNVSDKVISKWETGSSLPDITLINPLAEVLGITVSELLSAKELSKPVLNEEVNLKIITKFKVLYFIALGLFIVSLLIFPFGNYLVTKNEEAIGMILIVISIIFLISSIITYLVNNVWFRGLYTKYFYRKPYDLVFYKYNLVVIDIVSITLYALTLMVNHLAFLLIIAIVISTLIFLGKLRFVKSTMHTLKDRNQLLFMIGLYLFSLLIFIIAYLYGMSWMTIFFTIPLYIFITSYKFYRLDYSN